MASFPNTQGIDSIQYEKSILAFCPIGQRDYVANIRVTIDPGRTIPDYLELDAEIEKLRGQTLLVEDCAAKVRDIIAQYKPIYANVSVKATHAGHSDVIVTTRYQGGANEKDA